MCKHKQQWGKCKNHEQMQCKLFILQADALSTQTVEYVKHGLIKAAKKAHQATFAGVGNYLR